MNNNENLNNGNSQPLENNLTGVNMNSEPDNNMVQNPGVVSQAPIGGVDIVQNTPTPTPMPAPAPTPVAPTPAPAPMPNPTSAPEPVPVSNSVPPMGSQTNPNMGNGATGDKKIKPLYIIAPVAVIVVIIAIYFIYTSFGGSYKTPINNYCKLMQTFDVSLIDKLVPKEVINSDDYNDLVENINDTKDYIKELNGKFEVKCDIESAEKLDADDLEAINEIFQEDYNSKRKISQAYDVEFTMHVNLEYDGETTSDDDTESITVGKIGNKWYLVNN